MNLVTLSKLLGVSSGTISRVLNGHPSQRITEERRRYIVEGAKKHGYSPSVAARSLAISKTLNIALVMHHQTSPANVVNHTPVMSMMMALEKVLQSVHYGLNLVFITRDTPELSFCKLVQGKKTFDAVVFPTGVATKGIIDFAEEYKIPHAVICDQAASQWDTNSFHVDEAHDAKYAVEYLKELGHQKIAVIGWDQACGVAPGSFSHFAVSELNDHGISIRKEWVITADSALDDFYSYRDHGRAAMKQILSGEDRPTAIMASKDLIALGLIDVIHDSGLQAGKDISIIGHGNIEELSTIENHIPVITTFHPPIDRIGEIAAEVLLAQINKPDLQNQCKGFPSKFIVRESTRKVS